MIKVTFGAVTLHSLEDAEALIEEIDGRLEVAEDDRHESRYALAALSQWVEAQAAGQAWPVTLKGAELNNREAAELATTLENLADHSPEAFGMVSGAGPLPADPGAPAWAKVSATDEAGAEFPYGRQWAYGIKGDDKASNGQRVTTAQALHIASDVLEAVANGEAVKGWNAHDLRLALGAIAGLRAQRGCEEVTADGCEYLTHLCDVVIYG